MTVRSAVMTKKLNGLNTHPTTQAFSACIMLLTLHVHVQSPATREDEVKSTIKNKNTQAFYLTEIPCFSTLQLYILGLNCLRMILTEITVEYITKLQMN